LGSIVIWENAFNLFSGFFGTKLPEKVQDFKPPKGCPASLYFIDGSAARKTFQPFPNGLISIIVTAKFLHFALGKLTCSLEHDRAK
jgi:hypothetical protein